MRNRGISHDDHEESIMKHATAQDECGQSISLFVLVIMSALIITTGLVIDGGQKVTARSRAESAAAGASRAAGNAAASTAGRRGWGERRRARCEGLPCRPARRRRQRLYLKRHCHRHDQRQRADDLALGDRH